MTDRTFGETKNCAGCRFWSEMVAQCVGGGPVTALCLVDSGRYAGKYTAGFNRCASWKSGHYGAVDDPPDYGAETRALYAEEEEATSGPES